MIQLSGRVFGCSVAGSRLNTGWKSSAATVVRTPHSESMRTESSRGPGTRTKFFVYIFNFKYSFWKLGTCNIFRVTASLGKVPDRYVRLSHAGRSQNAGCSISPFLSPYVVPEGGQPCRYLLQWRDSSSGSLETQNRPFLRTRWHRKNHLWCPLPSIGKCAQK